MALQNLLLRLPSDCVLWSTSTGDLSVDDIRRWLIQVRPAIDALRGKRVAVAATDDLNLVSLLVALDGWASELILLPVGDLESAEAVARESKPDVVVSFRETFRNNRAGFSSLPRKQLDQLPAPSPHEDLIQGVDLCDVDTASRWLIRTSGTTGPPKLVSHSLASLTRTVKVDVGQGGPYCWGSLYGMSSFAGLQVFLQSWFTSSKLLLNSSKCGLTARIRDLGLRGCNALSATPTMWRMVLMSGEADHLDLRRVTLGGEIADQEVLDALRRQFPKARIVHIYASTEVGVGFAVRDGLSGFPAEYLRNGPDGVKLDVSDDGRLLARPEKVDQHYEDGRALIGANGFIDTGDLVERRGDRYHFLGRATGAINVGGMKVHPQDVESTILEHPGVLFVKVQGRKNPFTGSVVKATAVLTKDAGLTNDEASSQLTSYCRRRLPPHQVPAIFEFVDSLDLSSTGKIKR